MIQQEIADTLKKDKSAILRHINLFESQGLITRSNTANDKRMNVIQITERGRQLLVVGRCRIGQPVELFV